MLQGESVVKQSMKFISIASYALLACQVINAITIQPYLVYKLRGNLKIVTFVEYISLFVITASHLYKVNVTYHYIALELQTKIKHGQYNRNLLHAIGTIQTHSSNIRKCMLTLITSDFRQLIVNPIRFKEYMRFKNQISRYLFILAFTFFFLVPNYVRIIIVALTNHKDYMHLIGWTLKYVDPLSPSGFEFVMIATVIFYVVLLVVCGVNLVKIKQKEIEMKANSESCKTNIQSLIFMVFTITTLIFIAFVIALYRIIRGRINVYVDVRHVNMYVDIPFIFSLFYEGIIGLVVTFSLLACFPQLRPTLIHSPLHALPAVSEVLPVGSEALPAGIETLPAASEALPAPSKSPIKAHPVSLVTAIVPSEAATPSLTM